MKSFKEYLYDKEDQQEEAVNESVALTGAAAILGLSAAGVVVAYGGAQLLFALSKGTKKLIKNWMIAVKEFKSIKEVKLDDYNNYEKNIREDKLVNKVYADEKSKMDKYSDILKDVYAAIEAGGFTKTERGVAEAFAKLPKNLQNSTDIKRAIINKIIVKTGEPPLWPPSPGNVTYQAIKYSIGIREAKAQATAFKYNAVQTLERVQADE